FHFLDERGFRVARRGLGRVLGDGDILAGQRLAGLDLGQAAALLVVRVVVLLFSVGGKIAVESDNGADGAQAGGTGAIDGLDLYRGSFNFGRVHLAGDRALPDDLVETCLIGIKILANACRRTAEVGRADSFVRF